ncbi:MAG: Cof-type HAD-IIB family hydrolase [Spirochaetaceae bacterium]|jgi:Cof subfamily protein (haloacid dehalogenase superfamily)|nr:Cof-type HAD-IIB family hydrolase [Spirochaetaceae bacterium]
MKLQKDRIKAVVVDLDGTTLGTDAVLSERTRLTLRSCIARGIRVVIATGRSVEAAEQYRKAIGVEGAMVYYNGAMTLDMPSRSILDSHFIGQDVISCCVDVAHEKDAHFHLFLCNSTGAFSETLMAERSSGATTVYRNRTGLDFLYGNLYRALPDDGSVCCIKGIFIEEERKLRGIQQIVMERLNGKVNTMLSAEFILEILAADVTKASGLRAALKFYGLSPSEIIAFGDEENDIAMLSFAGHSVAPANARQSVRDIAKSVIGPNTDDSVAVFLENLFSLPPV